MNISVTNKFAVAGFLVVAVMAMIGQAQASDAAQAGWRLAGGSAVAEFGA